MKLRTGRMLRDPRNAVEVAAAKKFNETFLLELAEQQGIDVAAAVFDHTTKPAPIDAAARTGYRGVLHTEWLLEPTEDRPASAE